MVHASVLRDNIVMMVGLQMRKKKKTYQGSNGGQAKEGSKRQRTRSQTTFYQGSEAWLRMWWRAAGRGALSSVIVSTSRWQWFLLTRRVNHKGSKGRVVRNDTGRPFIDNGWRELLSLAEKGWVKERKKKKHKTQQGRMSESIWHLPWSSIDKLWPSGHMQYVIQHVKPATLKEILIVGKS